MNKYMTYIATFRNPSEWFIFPFMPFVPFFHSCAQEDTMWGSAKIMPIEEKKNCDIYWIKYLNGIFSFVTFFYHSHLYMCVI